MTKGFNGRVELRGAAGVVTNWELDIGSSKQIQFDYNANFDPSDPRFIRFFDGVLVIRSGPYEIRARLSAIEFQTLMYDMISAIPEEFRPSFGIGAPVERKEEKGAPQVKRKVRTVIFDNE